MEILDAEEKERSSESSLKEITTQNLSNLGKKMKIQIKEAQ
jgi:hypothetical protein